MKKTTVSRVIGYVLLFCLVAIMIAGMTWIVVDEGWHGVGKLGFSVLSVLVFAGLLFLAVWLIEGRDNGS